MQDTLNKGAAGRRRIDPRAPLLAVLVLLAGAVLGAILYQFEQSRATWRPTVTRTATGWVVRNRYGRGPGDLALAGDHIAWNSGPSTVTMDLGSGKTTLLGVSEDEQRMSPPSVSGQYAVWLTITNTSLGEVQGVYAYDFASRRRVQLSLPDVQGIWDSPSVSGTTIVWLGAVSGNSTRYGIRGEELSTGKQFLVASATMTAKGYVGLGYPVIAGDLVAWSPIDNNPHAEVKIVVKDLATRQTRTIVPFKSARHMTLDGWTLSGHTVVWSQSDGNEAIVAYNLDSGARRVIASGRNWLSMPAIDDDLVVWTETVWNKPTTLVMGLHLSSGRSFVIRTIDQRTLQVESVSVSGEDAAMLLDDGQSSWIETMRVPQ